MKLSVVATGSRGNCYVLSGERGESLVLDAGVPMKKALPHIPDFRKVEGCLITHEHNDHAVAWRDYRQRGIPIIASRGTVESLWADIKPAQAMDRTETGTYTVMPFAVQHDAAEPYGFLIRYRLTGETVLYATDTYYLRYTFPGVNYWIVECNYCEDLVDDETDPALRGRLKSSHMSLRRLQDALAANDLTDTAKIVLVHLSDLRSDEERMMCEIAEQTGIETVAARPGMEIDLNKTPF